jgi:hypothetical protein
MRWRSRLPRVRTDMADWQDWQRPNPCRIRRVEMRHAQTGLPVEVLKPTLWGRVVMVWRQWREVD